ncbi:hypothetical protein TNCV_342141 [Trichonephila clavipes]|nr:hypothetical protein TNCV_342141 [Trichonephila clavipes]
MVTKLRQMCHTDSNPDDNEDPPCGGSKFSHWRDMVVGKGLKGRCRLRCRPRLLTEAQNYDVHPFWLS